MHSLLDAFLAIDACVLSRQHRLAARADCYTPWCGGCKMISPNLTRMAAEKDLQKLCTFVKVSHVSM
jgi:thiol-disulfide isomerase/thioredoxin